MTKPYATLSVPEQWQWHAEIFAFRRVALGVGRDERTSPCDPDGAWFDASLVEEAERRLRNTRAAKQQHRRDDSDVCDARDIENKWAQQRGYNDFEHYKQMERLDHVDACVRVAKSFIIAASDKWKQQPADQHAATALGVTAREILAESAE